MTEKLEHFACPVCGRLRPLAYGAALRVRTGEASGECAPGHGCRAALDQPERHRRDWLEYAGVAAEQLRPADESRAYVVRVGVNAELLAMSSEYPENAQLQERLAGGHDDGKAGARARGLRRRTAA